MTDDGGDNQQAQRRALILIPTSQLLALTLWFSASAVGPELEDVWGLTMGQTAGLTLAVQIGFVVGALGSAVLGLADALASRRLFVIAALIGAATNAALVVLGLGDHLLAFMLRLLTGMALAGVYPSGLKVMAGWYRRGRGMALGLLVGALTVGSAGPHLIRGVGFNWRGVVLVASALAVTAAAVMWVGVADGPFEVPSSRFSRRQLGRVVKNRRFACQLTAISVTCGSCTQCGPGLRGSCWHRRPPREAPMGRFPSSPSRSLPSGEPAPGWPVSGPIGRGGRWWRVDRWRYPVRVP